jgi:hypothetical protein
VKRKHRHFLIVVKDFSQIKRCIYFRAILLAGIVACSSLYITDRIKKQEEWRTSENVEKYTEVAPELYNGPVVVNNKPGGLCAERLQIIDDDDWKGIPVYLEIAFKFLEGIIFVGLFCMRNRRGLDFDVEAR